MEFTLKEIEAIVQVFNTIEQNLQWNEKSQRYESGLIRFKADDEDDVMVLFNLNNKLRAENERLKHKG